MKKYETTTAIMWPLRGGL